MKIPSPTRIEAFSDRVVAIIIAILVLELKVPQLAEQFSDGEAYGVVQNMVPKLVAYA